MLVIIAIFGSTSLLKVLISLKLFIPNSKIPKSVFLGILANEKGTPT